MAPPIDAVLPDRATVSGVELAELVMLQDAVSVPEVVGLKSTDAVQLVDAAREEPQVAGVVTPKSLAPVPVIPGALSVTELLVLFVMVIV